MAYDAFISYSHKGDGRIASLLQRSLKNIAKPWYRLRSLNVFRDETNLSASADLTGAIRSALSGSSYFIYLASPESATSEWVGKEIDAWRQRDLPENLLIAVTSGEIEWDSDKQSFNWQKTNALHPNLRGIFSSEPLWVDLRWARKEGNLSLRDPRFRNAAGMLAASISGKSLEELIGEDVRQHQRTKIVAWTGISILALLFFLSILFAIVATKANLGLQSKIEMTETVFPFFEMPINDGNNKEIEKENDSMKSFFRRVSGLFQNLRVPVGVETWVKWGPEMIPVAEDFNQYQKESGSSYGNSEFRPDFDQDGLRMDIPGLNAMAKALVRSLNDRRFSGIIETVGSGDENLSGDKLLDKVDDMAMSMAMHFVKIILPERLWSQVDEKIRGDEQLREFDTHHYLKIWRHTLHSKIIGSELILVSLQDVGYMGSRGVAELILGFLRIEDNYELILAINGDSGDIAIYDAGEGNVPQIFLVSVTQSGINDQYRYIYRYIFDKTNLRYIRYMVGRVRSRLVQVDQQVPNRFELMHEVSIGIESGKRLDEVDDVAKSESETFFYDHEGSVVFDAIDEYNVGIDKIRENDLDGAMAHFNKAIEKDSDYINAYNNRCVVYLKKGEVSKALDDINKAISLSSASPNPDFYFNRGIIYGYYQKEYKKAFDDFSFAKKLGLDNDSLGSYWADMYWSLSDDDRASLFDNK